MTATQLRRTVLNRYIQPFALFNSLATLVIAVALATDEAVGALLKGLPGEILAVLAFAVVVVLWSAWWTRSTTLMSRGLLWAGGVWMGVSAVLWLEGWSQWVSASLALCWAGASIGAWWLEVDDYRRRRGQ